MHRHFDQELLNLKDQVVEMGRHVELAIKSALEGLTERDERKLEKVFGIEAKINQMHMAIDENCVRLLALESPLAGDLRLIVGIIKINADLERMGDQAVNISQNGSRYITEPALAELVDLPNMAMAASAMVREALDGFFRGDMVTAREVLAKDDYVDGLKNKVLDELVTDFMQVDPTTVRRSVNLLLIARNLERIGDHATNVAEATIFAASGKDVRHGQRQTQPAGMRQKSTP